MAGLDPVIHAAPPGDEFDRTKLEAMDEGKRAHSWMAGSSPAMTPAGWYSPTQEYGRVATLNERHIR
jgi:hypothetical protein